MIQDVELQGAVDEGETEAEPASPETEAPVKPLEFIRVVFSNE